MADKKNKKINKDKEKLVGNKSERDEAWFRIVVLIVTGIILCLWRYVAYALIVVNWILTLIKGYRNKEITMFNEYWNTTLYNFMKYMSGVTNTRPFPFTPLKALGKFEK
jgi:hypothetical protein